MRIVVRAGALALACLGAAAGPVLAQTYPTKPITMIVPYPPGGATDVIGRVLGQQLSINLGAPVVIENRTGAAGNIGAQAAAQAKPDGYTLLMGALTSHSINAVLQPGVVKYNLQKDFAPVSIVGVVPLVLVVGSGAAWLGLSVPVRMRKPKNAAAAMASRATTPRTSGIGDRRCALCFPTFNQSFRCDGVGVEPVASCSPG